MRCIFVDVKHRKKKERECMYITRALFIQEKEMLGVNKFWNALLLYFC